MAPDLAGFGDSAARPAWHLGAARGVGRALPPRARHRALRARHARLGRPDRHVVGVRAPGRRGGARDQLDRLLPRRQVARHGEGAARARDGRAAARGDRPRRLRRRAAVAVARHDRRGDRRVLEGVRRRRAPRAASSRCTAPATSRSSSASTSPRSACRPCSCGARTTSSRPWPAPTASSASCSDTELVVVEGARHFVWEDAPDECAAALTRFLAETLLNGGTALRDGGAGAGSRQPAT